MIEIESSIENKRARLIDFEHVFKRLGYVIGGNWEYERGFFDYKLADENGYVFLRVPFEATKGEIGEKGVEVELKRPFILAHQYEDGLDEQLFAYPATLNQFSEPKEKDASVAPHYVEIGKQYVRQLEEALAKVT